MVVAFQYGDNRMKTWIALLRGINVGGKNLLPMADLRRDLESIGLDRVRTYIQSGNVVFGSSARSARGLARKIEQRIDAQHGFQPHVFVLDLPALRAAVDGNPFPDAVADPRTLHYFFLDEPALKPDLEAIDAVKAPSERYRLADDVLYFHAPDGIGRSRLAASVERHLGVVTTGRNARTVAKMLEMATELAVE